MPIWEVWAVTLPDNVYDDHFNSLALNRINYGWKKILNNWK